MVNKIPGEGGGLLPINGLMGMCFWMGSHFHDWIGYNAITSEIAVHDSPLKAAVGQVYDSIFSENQGKLAGGVRQSRRRYTAGNRLLLKPL